MIELLERAAGPHEWDERPVFCFTSDIDWASETVFPAVAAGVVALDGVRHAPVGGD